MTRIGTYGASQMYTYRMNMIQARMDMLQTQAATQKKSLEYSGIGKDTNLAVNFENQKATLNKYISNNSYAETKLEATSVSMEAAEKTIKTFRDQLKSYQQNQNINQQDVNQIQEFAFQAMLDLKSYLGSNVNGQYLFSGGRTSTDPIKMDAGTLADFQRMYNGSSSTYPTTRDAHMQDFVSDPVRVTGPLTFDPATGTITASAPPTPPAPPAPQTPFENVAVGSRITVAGASAANNQSYTIVAKDSTNTILTVSPLATETAASNATTATVSYGIPPNTTTIDAATLGGLSFVPGADTITPGNVAAFAALPVGTVFTVSGTANNNGSYEIGTNTAGAVEIKSVKIGTAETSATATLSSSSWYQGDDLPLKHQVDTARDIDLGIFASDPAFEKAFRAMGIIAQGSFGSAGGLDTHQERVAQAVFLAQDAVECSFTPGPFGPEKVGDLQRIQAQVGVTRSMLLTKNYDHREYMNFLDKRIIAVEGADPTEAVTKLLDEQRALQISYQSLAKMKELSLMNYLK